MPEDYFWTTRECVELVRGVFEAAKGGAPPSVVRMLAKSANDALDAPWRSKSTYGTHPVRVLRDDWGGVDEALDVLASGDDAQARFVEDVVVMGELAFDEAVGVG